ncbi:MAG: hypothetical protein AB7F40_11445 [Victivallaceae bacterium]
MENEMKLGCAVIALVILAAVVAIPSCCYLKPKYDVWQQGLVGQAELARAEANRKIKIQEAEATKEAAKALAEQDIDALRVAKVGETVKTSEGKGVAVLRESSLNLIRTCTLSCCWHDRSVGFCYNVPCARNQREDKRNVYFEKVEATK